VVIRRAIAADHDWIRTVAADVYRELGDYRTIIGSWLDHPGATCHLEVGASERRGFILVGFYPAGPWPAAACVADLLAIAVARPFQRQGIGKRLLECAIELAEAARDTREVLEMRLTVADSNHIGQRLFASTGFTVIDKDHGHYDGGQRAIRMGRRLTTRTTSPAV
jgi:ribosomal protein S18 acetylase RimI-like enzyme